MSSQGYCLSASCHLDSGEDNPASRQASTASLDLTKPNSLHTTDSSRHHHMCKISRVLVQNCHTGSVHSPSEDCSRGTSINNDTLYSENNPGLSNSCTQNFYLHQHRNVKCDTTSHKPPILPRKVKNNKPVVPPRTLGSFANYSIHDTIVSSKNGTLSSAATKRQDEANPVHDGHETQTKTHEMVVLRHHLRCVNHITLL